MMTSCVFLLFLHTQDGDIIAPELTPLKKSWSNNNDGEDGGEGSSGEVKYSALNGPKKAKKLDF